MELTDKAIRALRPEKRKSISDKSYRHNKPRKGLVLLASPSGNHAWLYERTYKGARIKKSLGAYPELTLAGARELVDDINDHDGGPEAALDEMFVPEEAFDDVLTVDRLINRYIEKECEPFNKDWKNQELILKRELEPYLTLPATDLTTEMVEGVVQDCLDRKAPRSAMEALKQVRGMFNWALGKKRNRRRTVSKQDVTTVKKRKAIEGFTFNPADGLSMEDYEPRTYHLEGAALKLFPGNLAASDLREDYKHILLIQLQTFCRVGEVAGMRWDELGLKKREWLIPAERYKTDVAHRVMLSRQTAKLLRHIKKGARSQQFVFPMLRGTTAWDKTVDKPIPPRDVAKAINASRGSLKQHKDFTSHSLRHTGSTWLGGKFCPEKVKERLLGHAIDKSDMSERYNHNVYLTERKDWTQQWCDFLEGK